MDNAVDRLRALWKSGRDKYVSFFAVLEEVRREIGDEALPKWCVDNLRVGLAIIAATKDLLIKTDADIVKQNLAAAKVAAKEQTYKDREEARHVRELKKQERAKKEAEAKAEVELAKAETERAKAETNKARDTEKRRRKKTDPAKTAERKRQKLILNIPHAELADLVKRFKDADIMCKQGIRDWIEGSVARALILHAARVKLPDNQKFNSWLEANSIYPGKENRDIRTALIGLGSLGEARLREILTDTERRSYRYIWEKNRVVDNPELSLRSDNAELPSMEQSWTH